MTEEEFTTGLCGFIAGALVILLVIGLIKPLSDAAVRDKWCGRLAEVGSATWPECLDDDQKVRAQ